MLVIDIVPIHHPRDKGEEAPPLGLHPRPGHRLRVVLTGGAGRLQELPIALRGIVDQLGEENRTRRGQGPTRPPQVQGGRVALADRLLAGGLRINGVEGERDLNELPLRHGRPSEQGASWRAGRRRRRGRQSTHRCVPDARAPPPGAPPLSSHGTPGSVPAAVPTCPPPGELPGSSTHATTWRPHALHQGSRQGPPSLCTVPAVPTTFRPGSHLPPRAPRRPWPVAVHPPPGELPPGRLFSPPDPVSCRRCQLI